MRRAGDVTETDAILNYKIATIHDKLDKIIIIITVLIVLYIVLVGVAIAIMV